MGKIFDPVKWLKRVLPKDLEKSGLLNEKLEPKKTFLKAIVQATAASGKQIKKTVYETVKFYTEKEAELKAAGVKAFKQEALNGQALLTQRIKNFLVYNEVTEQKEEHRGQYYRWLPSSAETPDPEHQLMYGRICRVGEGDKDGKMPGERYGCQCGIEWLDEANMTPEEKIETLKLDFSKDSYLPNLGEKELKTIGAKSKPVVFKQTTIERNLNKHYDISKKEYAGLIGQALYKPLVRPVQDDKQKDYWHFIGQAPNDHRAVVLLDIADRKKAFEIVHVWKVRKQSAARLLKKLGFMQ